MPIAINGTGTISGVSAGGLTSASNGRILQVVQAVKTDVYSATISTFTDVPSLSVSITPSSASNKILVFADVKVGQGNGYITFLNLVRNSTTIYIGNTAGSRTSSSSASYAYSVQAPQPNTIIYLDSPATTSAVTYKIQCKPEGNNPITINSGSTDADFVYYARTASSITVMEVAG
jgi:hypothetical protein